MFYQIPMHTNLAKAIMQCLCWAAVNTGVCKPGYLEK